MKDRRCCTDSPHSVVSRNLVHDDDDERFLALQSKRLALCQQRVRLEQRLHACAAAAMATTAPDEPHEPPGRRRLRLPWTRKRLGDEEESVSTVGQSSSSSSSPRETLVVNQPLVLRIRDAEPWNDLGSDVSTVMACSLEVDCRWTGPWRAGAPSGVGTMVYLRDDLPAGVYTGGMLNGRRHGHGVHRWTNQQRYSGEWHGDHRHGTGTHTWPNGRTVSGSWQAGQLHGHVFFQWPDGVTYDGDCRWGRRHGRGVQTWEYGRRVYRGQYQNGHEHGLGTLTNGPIRYHGQFQHGQRHGYGLQMWPHKSYDGEWQNNTMHGRGKLTWYHSGANYTGEFVHNQYQGSGCFLDSAGHRYVGSWLHGLRHGRGIQYWTDGRGRYSGQWVQGKPHGFGIRYYSDGQMANDSSRSSVYFGGWHNGARHGWGIVVNDGTLVVHCGQWKDGNPVRISGRKSCLDDGVVGSNPRSQVRFRDDMDIRRVEKSTETAPRSDAAENADFVVESSHMAAVDSLLLLEC
jgi:hypothetical protein